MLEVYIEGSLVRAGFIISFGIKEWMKALSANIALIEVTLLDVSSPEDVR